MKIVGFNFTKINAERALNFKSTAINTNVDFVNIEEEKTEFLKDGTIVKASFRFKIEYLASADKKEDSQGKIEFNGTIILSADKKEADDIIKSWKKKELAEDLKISLLNVVIKKCSAKALTLEEELDLPPHFPLPRIPMKKK